MYSYFLVTNVSEENTARTWKREELPATDTHVFENLDHHHNMVRRLQLLPLTARGNQIKKNVAFLYLQYMLETPKLSLRYVMLNESENANFHISSDITDVMEMLKTEYEEKDGIKISVRANFKALAKSEHYAALNMIRLIDMIVGNEPEDYETKELVDAQKEMIELLSEISKKLLDDYLNIDKSQLQEFIRQVTNRWKNIHRKKANESTVFSTSSSRDKKKTKKKGGEV